MESADVVIIGAGAVGSALAHRLAQYDLEVVLLDKNEDVGGDASKSNSAIIHTGFDASPGSLESRLVVAANPMYDQLCSELDVPFERCGALLAAVTEEEHALLPEIYRKAHENGVFDVRLLSAEEAQEMEPEISPELRGALFVPRESLIDPFLWVVALAENAVSNGVRLRLLSTVTEIVVESGKVRQVVTSTGSIQTRFVVNAAGLHGDDIAAMVGECDFTVHPRKGQFFILDRNAPYELRHIVLPVPTKHTKGKLASPTPHGNILIGPTAEDLSDKQDSAVTQAGMHEVVEGVRRLVPRVSAADAVTEYAGLRPTRTPAGYFIEASERVYGYIGATGIRSTGLTSSPAVAAYIEGLLAEQGLELRLRSDYQPGRRGTPRFAHLSPAEQAVLAGADHRYGRVVCRCETVTEGQVVDAIHRPAGARSMDAIKRRLRAGMGRCQGGFCGPRVLEILSRELGVEPEQVTKRGPGSEIIVGRLGDRHPDNRHPGR